MAEDWRVPLEDSVRLVDSQHQEIFDLSTRYFAALERAESPAALEAVVRRLTQFLRLHLDVEENLMKRIGYPDFDAHKANHATLAEKLAAVADGAGRGESVADQVRALMDSFVLHHDHTDRPLLAFIRSKLAVAA